MMKKADTALIVMVIEFLEMALEKLKKVQFNDIFAEIADIGSAKHQFYQLAIAIWMIVKYALS